VLRPVPWHATVLVNAALFLEGFDEPSISCIIVASPTRSQVRYTQVVGRGHRPFPGKDDCLVLDVVGASDASTCRRSRACSGSAARWVSARRSHRRSSGNRKLARRAPPATAGGKAKRDAAMRSREVQLLRAPKRDRRLRWLRHEQHWLLAAGQAVIALAPDRDRWSVLVLDPAGVHQLAGGVDLAYAHRCAPSWPTAEPDAACVRQASRASTSRTSAAAMSPRPTLPRFVR